MRPQLIPDQPTLIQPTPQITHIKAPSIAFGQPEYPKIAEIEPDVSSSIQRDIVHVASAHMVSTANTLRKRNTFRFKTIAGTDSVSLKEKSPSVNMSASSSSSGTVATRSKPIVSKHTTTRKYAKDSRSNGNKINRNHRGGSVKKRVVKSVVFNGTFPIDEPMSSRFEIYSNSDSGSIIDDEDDFDDENDQCHIDESLSDEPPDRSMSIQQLVSYKSRHSEYEKSFSDFDKFIENRRKMYQPNW